MQTNYDTISAPCKACGKPVQGEIKISKSEKNPGKPFISCPDCNAFLGWFKNSPHKSVVSKLKQPDFESLHQVAPPSPSSQVPTLMGFAIPGELVQKMEQNQAAGQKSSDLLEKILVQLERMNENLQLQHHISGNISD